MKKFTFALSFSLMTMILAAQVPAGFSYQAVVRNSTGEIVSNQAVKFRFTILLGSATGMVMYMEIQNATTNAFGLANVTVGKGTPVQGSFGPTGWGSTSHFLKVELDASGGTTFTHLGTMELMSVPYAFHAKTVEQEADGDPGNEIQDLNLSGTVLSLSGSTKTVTLPSSGGGDNWGTDYVRTDATLAGQGTATSLLKIAQQSATTGNVLKWNGTTWSPAADETGGSLWIRKDDNIYYNDGFVGIGTTDPETPLEVASTGIPIIKLNNKASNNSSVQKITFWKGSTEKFAIGYDLWGTGNELFTLFDTPGQKPVLNIKNGNMGIGTINPGASLEVAGQVKITGGSPGSGKVLTSDASGLASWQIPVSSSFTLPFSGKVSSDSSAFSVTNINTTRGLGIYAKGTVGIEGFSDVEGGTGVSGNGTQNGVYGQGQSRGVIGVTYHSTGRGVMGLSNSSSGESYGVYGKAESSSGTGVYGEGQTAFRGITSGNQGYGIYVSCSHASSVTRAVYASVSSSTGFSGYFAGGKFYVGGNVGIGTVIPDYRLEVLAPGTTSTGIAGFYNSESKTKVLIRQNINGCGAIHVYNSAETATISLAGEGTNYINSGRLGLGTQSPTQVLHVVGNAYKTEGGTSWAISSDLRLKTVNGNYNKGLDEITALQPVRFVYNPDNPRKLDSTKEQVGFVAQEIQKIFPDAVTEASDGFLDFNMHEINIALVNAVKSLKTENELLKKRLEKLEQLVGASALNVQKE